MLPRGPQYYAQRVCFVAMCVMLSSCVPGVSVKDFERVSRFSALHSPSSHQDAWKAAADCAARGVRSSVASVVRGALLLQNIEDDVAAAARRGVVGLTGDTDRVGRRRSDGAVRVDTEGAATQRARMGTLGGGQLKALGVDDVATVEADRALLLEHGVQADAAVGVADDEAVEHVRREPQVVCQHTTRDFDRTKGSEHIMQTSASASASAAAAAQRPYNVMWMIMRAIMRPVRRVRGSMTRALQDEEA